MTALSDQLRQRVAQLRPGWDPDALSGFLYLEGGYSNDNYRFEYGGGRYVLRMPKAAGHWIDRRLEEKIYRRGAAAQMPELVAFDADTGAMISRWVAGPMLTDRHPDAGALVDYLRRLHRHMPAIDRVYDPVAQARAHLQAADLPDWVERLAAALRWAPEQMAVCHNDLNPWNVICVTETEWVTLDWEWAGRNDPLFDLVTLHQGAGLADDELTGMAVELLGGPVAASRLTGCRIAFWLRETAWAAAEMGAGNGRPEVVAQRDLGLSRLQSLA